MSKKTFAFASSTVLFIIALCLLSACREKENKIPEQNKSYDISDFKILDSDTGNEDSVSTPQPYFYWKMSSDVPDGTYAVLRIAKMYNGETEEDALSKRGKDIAIDAEKYKQHNGVYRLPYDNRLEIDNHYAVSFTVHLPASLLRSRLGKVYVFSGANPKAYFKSLLAVGQVFNGDPIKRIRLGFEWASQPNWHDAAEVKCKIVKADWTTTGSTQSDLQQLTNASWRLSQVNAATGSDIILDWPPSSQLPPYSYAIETFPETHASGGNIALMVPFNQYPLVLPYGEVYIYALQYENNNTPVSIYTVATRYLEVY